MARCGCWCLLRLLGLRWSYQQVQAVLAELLPWRTCKLSCRALGFFVSFTLLCPFFLPPKSRNTLAVTTELPSVCQAEANLPPRYLQNILGTTESQNVCTKHVCLNCFGNKPASRGRLSGVRKECAKRWGKKWRLESQSLGNRASSPKQWCGLTTKWNEYVCSERFSTL